MLMGFPKEMVLKGIKEIGNTEINQFHFIVFLCLCPPVLTRFLLSGHSDANALLELLLTYKVFVHMILLLSLSYDAFAARWQELYVTIGHVNCRHWVMTLQRVIALLLVASPRVLKMMMILILKTGMETMMLMGESPTLIVLVMR